MNVLSHPWVRRLWPWLASALSGYLMALCFPPYDQHWLAWLCLIPWISALWFGEAARRPVLHFLLLGWIAGAVFFLTSLTWLITVTGPGWFALSLFLALYFALWSVFCGLICKPREPVIPDKRSIWMSSRNNLRVSMLGAAAWVALEFLRGTLFTGFGWNTLAVAIRSNVPLMQVSDITGSAGLSFLVVLTNLIGVLTIKRLAVEFRIGTLRPHYDFGVTLALIALAFVYGIRQMLAPAPDSIPLRVAAVQANIPQFQKWDAQFEKRIHDTYHKHTLIAQSLDPELIIWPEAATPRAVLTDLNNRKFVFDLAAQSEADFLLGTVHFDESGDYNAALLLTMSGRNSQMYHKVHLVPFGEYLPLRNTFPIFVWAAGHLIPEDFDAGPEPVVLEMSRHPITVAPLICFEDTLPNLVRQFVRQGAQLMTTLTNDGWFLESAGSAQHLANAVYRCAENKRPLVRAANTGITCFVDHFGRVTQTLEDESGNTFIEGVLSGTVQVPIAPHTTFFTRYGEVFSFGCLGLTLIVSSLAAVRTFRKPGE